MGIADHSIVFYQYNPQDGVDATIFKNNDCYRLVCKDTDSDSIFAVLSANDERILQSRAAEFLMLNLT